MQTKPSVGDRATSFSADNDSGTPPSLQAFGAAFMVLWLGMLALVYVARRRQLVLKARLGELESTLRAKS